MRLRGGGAASCKIKRLRHAGWSGFLVSVINALLTPRSIKYEIWCSTEHGNKRLDAAFREREGKGPVYLFYSVNGSGHFCGMAQMLSGVDYSTTAKVCAQDKWKGT